MSDHRDPGSRSGPGAALPPSRSFSVRAEFDGRVTDADLLLDLTGQPRHGLVDFHPAVTVNDSGRTEIELTVPAADVWTSVLMAMALIRQSGYDPAAVHVAAHPVAGPGLAA